MRSRRVPVLEGDAHNCLRRQIGDAAAEGVAGAAAGAPLLRTTLPGPASSKAARRRRLQAFRSPHAQRAGVRRALKRSILALRDAYVGSPDDVRRPRAWKLFLLTPRMLLARPKLQGAAGRRELLQRIQSHEQGQWQALLANARDAGCLPRKNRDTFDAEAALACPRTGLLARRAEIVEWAWCRVAREAVGLQGHVLP